MDPLRILHVTPYSGDAWAYGGIPRVVAAATRALAARGHDVVVCTTDACSAETRLAPPAGLRPGAPWQLSDADVAVRVFPNVSNRLAYHWQVFTPRGLAAYLRDHASTFDVAHLHACRNWPGVVAARILTAHGVPFVIGPNGTAPVIERRQWAKRVFDRWFGRHMLNRAAAVLAVSEAERRQLLALGVAPARIRLVPNPIDTREFDPPVDRRRREDASDGSRRPVIAFLGKVTPRKRVDLLVRACAAHADARLVIAGSDMGGLRPALALATALGMRDRVEVTGVLAGRDRLSLLADADVVAYPSEHEIFGLVPVEALMVGTPVVVADDSGCAEVVRTLGGGVVVPVGDVEALTTAIGHVLAAPERWRRKARAAGEKARIEFSDARIAEILEGIYREARPAVAPALPGVSFVMPVKNGRLTLPAAIEGIEVQQDGRPFEILAVDDGSTDDSWAWLTDQERRGRLRVIRGPGRGIAAAINAGVQEARHPIICQVDQDVEVGAGWLDALLSTLAGDPACGAVEGHYRLDRNAPLLARVMALDLEQRYAAARDRPVTHVCTGNTAYRASALAATGPFDETLGYGSDNDMSYRLRRAGYGLAHNTRARSRHHWRSTIATYCRQQYGFGYGRLDVVRRHPRHLAGDSVAPALMMAHPIALLAALGAAGLGLMLRSADASAAVPFGASAILIGALATERAIAGVRAAWHFGDRAALLFPVVHLLRDLCWIAAIAVWLTRRVLGRPGHPGHSMSVRPVSAARVPHPRPDAWRVAAIIPVHNEAHSIAAVLADLRHRCPRLDVIVVDDGSTDETEQLQELTQVTYVRLPERMGVGSAVRTGLRCAVRRGCQAAIRLDGDGQHAAADVGPMLVPILSGDADVVLGSRYVRGDGRRGLVVRAIHVTLARVMTAVTRRPVTDPTSGFCAVGPRALRLLAEHHPTGYGEAELRLLLARTHLSVAEVAVGIHDRRAGRTSLTASRLAAAGARVLLALLTVPLRRAVTGGDAD